MHTKPAKIFTVIFSLASVIGLVLPVTLFLVNGKQFRYYFYGRDDTDSERQIYVVQYLGSSSSVVIPSHVDSYSVQGIRIAFLPEQVSLIVISQGIGEIDHSFHGCDNLKAIFIPESVGFIDNNSFRECYDLKIYCQAESKPEGWSLGWNSDGLPVMWGANLSDITL